MDDTPDITFQRLRPTCVKLSKQPSRECIQELRESLEHVETDHLVKLTEYVFFPLQLTLQRTGLSNELKQDAVICIEAVICKAKVHKLNVFTDIFNALTVLLSGKEPGKVAEVSEELKLAILSCLDCLLDSSGLVIRSVLYRPKLLPSLGHAISLFLDIIRHEKARELKVAALKCLKIISFCDNSGRENTKLVENTFQCNELEEDERNAMYRDIRDSASIAMSSFLPGISLALANVVNSDPTQGHAIVSLAIDIWGSIVAMVMSDSCMPLSSGNNVDDDITATISLLAKLQTNANDDTQSEHDNASNNDTKQDVSAKSRDLVVNRTDEWFKSTGLKLKVLVERLTSTVSCHSKWKVRLSLVRFCESVLVNCSESMSCCISMLVDVLVGALEDEYSQVSLKSKEVLDTLGKQQDKKGSRTSFNVTLEENLYSKLTTLPRLMRTADDINKLRALNLLNGYMTLLNDKISIILSSSSQLKRLSLALTQILELDVSDVGIVEERTPEKHESAVIPSDTQGQNPMSVDTDNIQASQYPKYHFKHFTGDKIQEAVNHTCQLLGYHGDLSLLVDHFLDLFHESNVHRKQAVYVLNEIVVGFSTKCQDASRSSESELMPAVKLLLSAYTSQKSWNLQTSTSRGCSSTGMVNSKPNISYQKLNSNVLLTCLLLEGIGIFAHSLQHSFNPLLIDTLYLVLAKLGDGNAAISRSAYGTLVMISKNCGFSSVEDLITSNADYLVNSIALDLKYVFVNEQAPRVLRVMIQYSNQDILAIVEDTIEDVFSVMDLYPDQLIYALMKVLHALVYSMYQWFVDKQKPDKGKQGEQQFKGKEEFSQEISSFILNYIKSKRIALGEVKSEDLNDVESEEVDDEDFYKPDEKPEIPLHVKYATQVLEKCIYFLSSNSSVVRILVLDTVYYGVLALKEHENDLLPMIHRLWPPIVNRLADKDQVVIIKVINAIATMAECSGDFMKRRVLKDVLPRLLNLLEKQAEVSRKAGTIYSQSQAFKLQLAALEGLGRLCKQLAVREEHLYNVSCKSCVYLSSRQPTGLQEAAVGAFEKFIIVDPDLVWLVLNNLQCPVVPKPPQNLFVEVKLAGTGPDSKEYASNVSLLLGQINMKLH